MRGLLPIFVALFYFVFGFFYEEGVWINLLMEFLVVNPVS
jgi:hypothetical protein